jgi:hypothetical protein
VDRSSDEGRRGSYQVAHYGGRITPDMEVLQPQGLHFHVPERADGIMVSPAGEMTNAVLLAPCGDTPGGEGAEPGEGGLHYLGAYKVFLNAAGEVHLGQQVATNFVALANLVDARLSAIVSYINNHVHVVSNATPAGPGPVVAAAPAAPLAAQATVAATKVKAL